ncbi:MAG TPA: RNA methyltransferase [Pyrinomonadaceae bacterium]|nr:RNA methyltransferase [Pyrinomonadaceae bacterium]
METITSRDNSLLRQARAVRDGKADDMIFIEGLRLSEEALRSGLTIAGLIVSDELARKDKARNLITELETAGERAAVVSEKLLESISYTSTPQGIVVLAARPDNGEKHLNDNMKHPALVVVMHRINNPVNVGAILRTAEAAGATAAIATRETSDPFSPKSLRGAMGSAFRLPVWYGPTYESAIAWSRDHGIATVCADVHAESRHDDIDWRPAAALILGPESQGLSREEIALADQSISIPMKGAAESLNVAVAAGVLLYEAARQRG